MDARSTISATVCILIITFVISRLLKCQRIEMIPFLVLSIFVAPVFEEIFYRGLLISSLHSVLERRGFEGRMVALSLIIINPFIFSLSHVLNTYTFQFDAFVARLATGFVYALFYWYGKRNLIPVIVAHSIYNLSVNLCLFSYL
ncbi:MAG: CPBP family intramembrane metalloprotease [Thermoplasmata archaeon]|nr:MAG: CPBP family intramembrane metalloprotease [Thermoplasmata archaeon]